MKEPPLLLNFPDFQTKRRHMEYVSTLSGVYEVTLTPRKLVKMRTLSQLRYYFGAFVQPFTHWLRREYGDDAISLEETHEFLKSTLLQPREIPNRNTGEVLKMPPSTKRLTKVEISNYLEDAREFLAEFASIPVLPAVAYFETPKREGAAA